MIHALIRDLWSPIWPNLAASIIWTTPAFAWHHRAMRRHVTAEINRLHQPGTAEGGLDDGST